MHRQTYPLHAQPGGFEHVFVASIQASPQALPFMQTAQQRRPVAGGFGGLPVTSVGSPALLGGAPPVMGCVVGADAGGDPAPSSSAQAVRLMSSMIMSKAYLGIVAPW